VRGHHPSWESLSEAGAQLFPTFELGFRKCVFFTEVFPCLRVFFDRLVPWSVVCTYSSASRTTLEDGYGDDR
jgi:hypothetical protein